MNSSKNNLASSPLKFIRGAEHHAENEPLLTIVICAYKHEHFIEQCLTSVCDVVSTEIELIIIDDGSPDETLDRCIKFEFPENLSFRIFTKRNGGLTESLKLGLDLAKGRYVAFMGSDDLYVKGSIDSAIGILRDQAAPLDAVLFQLLCFGEHTTEHPYYGEGITKLFAATAQERLRIICSEFPNSNVLLLQASIFNVPFLRSIDPWGDGLALDDWPTFIKIFVAEAERGAVLRYIPEISLCHYRLHEGGMHNQLDLVLGYTEQVAMLLVPARLRAVCLANLRIDFGFIHLYEGRWQRGFSLFFQGLSSSMSWSVLSRMLKRIWKRILVAFSTAN